MNLKELFEKADESIRFLKRKIVTIVSGKPRVVFSLISPEQMLSNIEKEKFESSVMNMKELMLLAGDAEDALEEYKNQVELLEQQLVIVKETNSVLVSSMNAMKKEEIAV